MFKKNEHPIISKKHKATRYYKTVKNLQLTREHKKEFGLTLSCSSNKYDKTSNPEELYIKVLRFLSDKLVVSEKSIELEPDTKNKLESFGPVTIKVRSVFYGSVLWNGTLKLIILEGKRWD